MGHVDGWDGGGVGGRSSMMASTAGQISKEIARAVKHGMKIDIYTISRRQKYIRLQAAENWASVPLAALTPAQNGP